MFALPAVPGVLTQRELVVLAVRSGSQTAIRVDAQVVWLPARPVAERIPPAAASADRDPGLRLQPRPPRRAPRPRLHGHRPGHGGQDRGGRQRPDQVPCRRVQLPGRLRRADAAHLLHSPGRPGGGPADRGVRRLRVVSVRIGGRDMPALSEYPRSGPPLQQQVLAIAGVSWPVEPGVPANLALLPDLVTRAPAAGWWFVQDRDPRPEQEFGVGVRRAVGLGDAVGEPQRCHALVGPVDLAEHVAGLASEPNDPGRPLACCGSAVSVHMFSMPGRAVPRPVAVMPQLDDILPIRLAYSDRAAQRRRGGRQRLPPVRVRHHLRGVRRRPGRRPAAVLRVVRGRRRAAAGARAQRLHHRPLLRAGAAGRGGPDRAARGRRRPAQHLRGQAGRGAGCAPALPRGTAGGAAPGGGPGHPGAERLHRGLHPGRGRAAGRPPLHHALAERGRTRPPLPGGQGRSRRALRRRRPGDHQRGHGRRHRRVPLPGQEGAGLADRQRHRPAHGGAAASRRRPGASTSTSRSPRSCDGDRCGTCSSGCARTWTSR